MTQSLNCHFIYKSLLGLFLVLSVVGCGGSGDDATINNNLFFQSGNDQIDPFAADQPAFGLWESDEYEDNGLMKQIRWKLNQNQTVLAKMCEAEDGEKVYVQVELQADAEFVQSNTVTPFSNVAFETNKVSDVKVMSGNRPCRVALDPANFSSDSILASDTDEFTVSDFDLDAELIELDFAAGGFQALMQKIGY